jgi:hypothetical protein
MKKELILALASLVCCSAHSYSATLFGVAPSSITPPPDVTNSIILDNLNGASPLFFSNKQNHYGTAYESKLLPKGITAQFFPQGAAASYLGTYGPDKASIASTPLSPSQSQPFTATTWSVNGALETLERRGPAINIGSGTNTALIRLETEARFDLETPGKGIIEFNGQSGTTTSTLNASPTFLWSGTGYGPLAPPATGTGPADFNIMRIGGSNHKLELFKKPTNFTSIPLPITGQPIQPAITLDPELGTITINGLPVLTGTNSSNVFALGEGTTASGGSKTILGRYNTLDTGSSPNVVFAVGSGSSAARKDALTISTSGETTINGKTVLASPAYVAPTTPIVPAGPVALEVKGDVVINGRLYVAQSGDLLMGDFQ